MMIGGCLAMGQVATKASEGASRQLKSSLREQVSFYGSVLAVTITVITFYFTQIKHTEYLKVKTEQLKIFVPSDKTSAISFYNIPQPVVFANSGNRPIAITELHLTILLARAQNDDCTIVQDGDGRIRMNYHIGQPIIVKPSEVMASANALEYDNSVGAPDQRMMLSFDKNKNFVVQSKYTLGDTFYIRACLSAFVVTADDSQYETLLLTSQRVAAKSGQIDVVARRGAASKPELVYTHTSYGLF